MDLYNSIPLWGTINQFMEFHNSICEAPLLLIEIHIYELFHSTSATDLWSSIIELWSPINQLLGSLEQPLNYINQL